MKPESKPKITECPSFESCSAPLCPLDAKLIDRLWYTDEPLCTGHAGKGCRWIAKQRSIQRRQTKSWRGRPVTQAELYAASRPMQISDERRAALRDRMTKIRQKAIAGSIISEESSF